MAPALPNNIQLKLEQTLAQSPQWRCEPTLSRAPDIVKVLTPGVSNFSVLVELGQRFVVRIDGINPSTNGLSRSTEWRALEAAHREGLAPCPRYFNPDLGSLVCDYLLPEESVAPGTTELAQLLRAIHQLPARHHRLDLAERIRRYENRLAHKDHETPKRLQNCHNSISDLLGAVRNSPGRAVLCHNDLLQANRIYSAGKLWALDWEYCAMGDPWYDIAVVVNGDSMAAADTEALLIAYLGRSPTAEEQCVLHHYSCIYRYLELLWYLALDKPVLNSAAVEQKISTLTDMLTLRPR